MKTSDHTSYPMVFDSMPHTSPDILALEIQSALVQGNQFLANDLIRRLEPTIQQIASGVCTGASRSEREEFVMESASCFFGGGNAYAICSYDPTRPFGAWASMVLRRRWVDHCRRVKRGRTISIDSVAEPVYSIDWWNRELGQSLTFPFTLCDLWFLYSWSLRDRIEVLTLSGFFVRVPSQRWELLVQEYESEMGVSLSRPFPHYRIETPEDRLSLVNELAESTGQRPNSVRQNYIRKMHRLAEFPSIRRLRIGEDREMT